MEMILAPSILAADFTKLGEQMKETLEKIKACGAKAAISICPDTPVAELEPYVELVDMVLIMSVHPGFGGQSFIPSSLEKIRETRALLDRVNSTADIEVDGGIYTTNVREVLEAGANVIVAGSAIFRGDAAENTKNMMEILRAYE